MSNYSSYMGKAAMLDLCTREVKDYTLSDDDREKYIGGRAMAAKILSDCLKGNESALSEENIIVISTGPLTGTGAPCSNHFTVSAVSPVTGAVSYSSCGGDFGLYLKRAGFDALIIKGKCQTPTWLEIQNDKVTFNSARELWGLATGKAQEEMRAAINEKRGCTVKCGTLVIGPAGENLVNYATVVSGEREAEHCDIGAVFGYKNLKGILATGNHEISVADADKLRENNREWSGIIHKNYVTGELLPKEGTLGFASYLNAKGMLPTKNYSSGAYADAERICGETFADKHNISCRSCTYCPIRCERTALLDGKTVRGPELEAAALLGSNILNSDLKQIIRWNNEMLEYGLDAVNTAKTIAWAMQANEEGVFKCGLEFGITSKISEALKAITYRNGSGDELAEGDILLGKKYGNDFVYGIKPLTATAAECYMGVGVNKNGKTDKKALTDFAEALNEAVNSSGQCRMIDFADIPDCVFRNPNGISAAFIKTVLPLSDTIFKLLGILPNEVCSVLPHFVHTKALEYAPGMKLNMAQYVEVGKRGIELEKNLNEKFGVKKEKYTVPLGIAASKKAAKKSVADKLKDTAEKLRNIDLENNPLSKLLSREAKEA